MKSIFLSFAFRDNDRDVVSSVEQLLASHGIHAITGKRLGGEALDPAIQARIEQADGLIALLTRRDQLVQGGWTTHSWVKDELNHARAHNKRAIALVEDGVELAGMYADHERIPFNRDQPLDAMLALAETVGFWKAEAGRTLKVRIMPETVAQLAHSPSGSFQCQYRLFGNAQYTPWRNVDPVPEVGGTFVYLGGIQDEHLIQLEVKDGTVIWRSLLSSQWVWVDLNSNGANS